MIAVLDRDALTCDFDELPIKEPLREVPHIDFPTHAEFMTERDQEGWLEAAYKRAFFSQPERPRDPRTGRYLPRTEQ